MRDLPPGAVHSYTVRVSAGQYIRAETDQAPKNFSFRVYDPDGVPLGDAWATCRPEGPCAVPFITETSRPYRIEIRAPAAEPNCADCSGVRYQLRLHAASPAEALAERERLQAAISWIRDHAHALRGVEAGSGFEDLQPLKKILADARIIGLGEATHGTREFFQMKHRLLEFLAREMDVTLFAMEIDQGAAKQINDFVLHGTDERSAAIAAAGMWQWDTQEVAAMLDWMREHNRPLPEERKIRFVGFDFQVNDAGRDDVLRYLRRVAPQRVAAADSVLAPLVRRPDSTRRAFVEFYTLAPEQKKAVATRVKELFDFLVANRILFTRSTSATEYENVLQSARRLVQFTDAQSRSGYAQDDPESGVATRDRYMADNVARLLDEAEPETRMVLWSHNEHVRRDAYSMGHYLGERYGQEYYAFGFAFDRGGFRALEITGKSPAPVKTFTLSPAFQESVGWLMKRVGKGDAYVDFRSAPKAGPAAEWLGRPHPMRSIGNGYAPGNPSGYYRAPVVLGRSYDGLLFIEQTAPARGGSPY